jgi:hypothetical protein
MHRFDVGQGKAVAVVSGEEIVHRTGVGPAGVGIADGSGEELDEAAGGVVTRVDENGGQDRATGVPGVMGRESAQVTRS